MEEAGTSEEEAVIVDDFDLLDPYLKVKQAKNKADRGIHVRKCQ